MQGETESVITQRIDKNAAPRSKAADVLMRELRHFGTVFLYLAVVFGVFALHAFVVLADNGMSYQFYGASIINAVILAKILHVAEAFHFGEKFTGVRHVAGRCLCRRGSWRRPHSRQKSRRERARPRRRNARGHCGDRGHHVRYAGPVLRLQGNPTRLWRSGIRRPDFQRRQCLRAANQSLPQFEDSRDAGSRAMLSYLKLPALLRACHPSDLFAFFGIRGEPPSAVSA